MNFIFQHLVFFALSCVLAGERGSLLRRTKGMRLHLVSTFQVFLMFETQLFSTILCGWLTGKIFLRHFFSLWRYCSCQSMASPTNSCMERWGVGGVVQVKTWLLVPGLHVYIASSLLFLSNHQEFDLFSLVVYLWSVWCALFVTWLFIT